MSFTFKSLVLFIKIVTKLLLLRPFGNYNTFIKRKKCAFRLDGSSSLGFKLNQSAHLFNLFKMAANKRSRNGNVIVTSQVGQRGCKWVVQTVVQTGRASAGDGCSW